MSNPFQDMKDADLVRIYNDYQDWCNAGFIREGSDLSELRNRYKQEYGSSSILILERDFLRECAQRFCRDHQA